MLFIKFRYLIAYLNYTMNIVKLSFFFFNQGKLIDWDSVRRKEMALFNRRKSCVAAIDFRRFTMFRTHTSAVLLSFCLLSSL